MARSEVEIEFDPVRRGATVADLAAICEALVIRPGDTLIIRVRSDIYRSEFDEFQYRVKAGLDEVCPGVRFVIVNAEQLAVYRPGAETDG